MIPKLRSQFQAKVRANRPAAYPEASACRGFPCRSEVGKKSAAAFAAENVGVGRPNCLNECSMTLARFVEIVPKKPRVASRISSIVKPSSSGGGSIALASGCFIATSGSAYVSSASCLRTNSATGAAMVLRGGCGRRRLATRGGFGRPSRSFSWPALASGFAGAALFSASAIFSSRRSACNPTSP